MALDFNQTVLKPSHTSPVVVDFWAPWCGPCQYLTPVIEELAEGQSAHWTLVKINTDENPEISKQYHIRGIPAVKMFYQGEVIAEFTGALPKPQIQRWLAEHLPDKRKEALNTLLATYKDLPKRELLQALQDFIAEHPDFGDAKLTLAGQLVIHKPEESLKLLEGIKMEPKWIQEIEQIRNLAAFLTYPVGDGSKLGSLMALAQASLKEENYETSLESLIEMVTLNKEYADELPRKAIIALFNQWGREHSLTQKYRRRFDMALY